MVGYLSLKKQKVSPNKKDHTWGLKTSATQQGQLKPMSLELPNSVKAAAPVVVPSRRGWGVVAADENPGKSGHKNNSAVVFSWCGFLVVVVVVVVTVVVGDLLLQKWRMYMFSC